jgi:hypothetical protein
MHHCYPHNYTMHDSAVVINAHLKCKPIVVEISLTCSGHIRQQRTVGQMVWLWRVIQNIRKANREVYSFESCINSRIYVLGSRFLFKMTNGGQVPLSEWLSWTMLLPYPLTGPNFTLLHRRITKSWVFHWSYLISKWTLYLTAWNPGALKWLLDSLKTGTAVKQILK